MEVLKINNFSKTYHSINGETKAIDNISFTINESEFVSIIGPSGCGKSTILNAISGLDNNYSGVITHDKSIGYMFQSDALFDYLTIFENALLGLKITKKINNSSKEYVQDLLKKYGLYEFKDKYPSSLSGGMKQRVG